MPAGARMVIDKMWCTHDEVDFKVGHKSHQNWLKTYFMNILRIFDDYLK